MINKRISFDVPVDLNFGIPEKRVLKNRENFLKFFTSHGRFANRSEIFNHFTPEQVIMLAKLYNQRPLDIEEIFSFARRFRQTTNEFQDTDIEDVKGQLDIKKVMDA